MHVTCVALLEYSLLCRSDANLPHTLMAGYLSSWALAMKHAGCGAVPSGCMAMVKQLQQL